MRLSCIRALLALSVLWASACFGPTFADGEVACGASGCPEGMVCRSDGLCYHDDDPGEPPDDSLRGNAALAVANFGAPNRLYAYCDGFLIPTWTAETADTTTSVAWGDLDRNGEPEVVFGNYDEASRGYDVSGDVRLMWTSAIVRRTRSIALVDVDGDGDDDLATGNEGQILRMFKWIFDRETFEERWGSDVELVATSVAWGRDEWDQDVNLAVGVSGGATQILEFDERHGDESMDLMWIAPESDDTRSVAWGDVDGDGELDLALGNFGGRNSVYRRIGWGDYVLWWTSDDPNALTTSVAWGDYDGDGDDDLVVGNHGGVNIVYRNDSGSLEAAWASPELDATTSVAWGDLEGDGDLDLLVGNDGQPNRAYRNDGGAFELVWSSQEDDATLAIAWREWEPQGEDITMCSGAAAR